MKKLTDISYASHTAARLDIFLPECDTFDAFIYFHGGGISGGDKGGHDHIAKYLTERNIAFISANYRMYPDAHYPDFIDDAAMCVKWVQDSISSYGSCRRIFVGGSSAGAYISMMLCFDGEFYEKYGIRPDSISGYVHDAGQPTCHFNVLRHSGIDSRRVIIDNTAPLYHVGTSPTYPPMHFIVSDNDMAGRYEQTMLLLKTLEHFGHANIISHTVMQGTHCHYISQADQNGDSKLGKLIYDFIQSLPA